MKQMPSFNVNAAPKSNPKRPDRPKEISSPTKQVLYLVGAFSADSILLPLLGLGVRLSPKQKH